MILLKIFLTILAVFVSVVLAIITSPGTAKTGTSNAGCGMVVLALGVVIIAAIWALL